MIKLKFINYFLNEIINKNNHRVEREGTFKVRPPEMLPCVDISAKAGPTAARKVSVCPMQAAKCAEVLTGPKRGSN